MIKKVLLSLGLCLFGFIGFSHGRTVLNVGSTFSDPFQSSNMLTVLPKGNLSTNGSKSVLFLGPKTSTSNPRLVYYWDLEGYLYTFARGSSTITQGRLKHYSVCDYFDTSLGSVSPTNCIRSEWTNNNYVSEFLSTITSSDYFTYDSYDGNAYIAVCYSSQSLNKSLCLCGGAISSNIATNARGTISCLLDSSYSKNYSNDITFDTFNTSDVGFSPAGGVGGNNGGIIVNGGNTYLCPTVGQLLATYGQEYNTGLCYSSSLLLQNGVVTTVEPQSIFELFENQSEFMSYRQLYGNYCANSVSTSSDCQNAFQGKDLQYTLLAKIPGSIPSLNLYSYCNLALNQDPNTSTCVAEGVFNTGVSRDDVINSIVDGDYQVIVPSTGSVADDVLGSGMELNGDFINTLQSIYTKFTSFFTTQSGNSNGIIPGYIISMLLVIILFKLFKK